MNSLVPTQTPPNFWRYLAACLFGLGLIQVATADDTEQKHSPEQIQFFEAKIRPVLVRECYGCHSNQAGNVRGGLRLDTRELMRIGGATGPAVVPHNLEESWLYNAITHQDYEMPPRRKLPQSVIDDFRRWIEMGAPDPRTSTVGQIQSSIGPEDITAAKATHWAYAAPKMPERPRVEDEQWPVTPIDHFVLARLEQAEITPSQDAAPHQILRRLCFDFLGLPPTPEQVAYFDKLWAKNPTSAISQVVDRLLESPQFGERWGRHWLDVARYAESTGRGVNMTYPHAWRYRDYVIDSFNADKPFNRFVQEQIAGDLLPVSSDEQWAENLIATTFLAIGAKNLNEQNRVQFRADLADEQIDATTRVFLGMSVACARCHDHKFDAIPQTDYYAMAGIFANATTYFGVPPSSYGSFNNVQTRQTSSLIILPVEDPNPYDPRYTPEQLAELKQEIEEKLAERAQLRRGTGDDARNLQRQRLRLTNEVARLSAQLAVVDDNGQPRSYCMGVQETSSPRNVRLLEQGEIDRAAQETPRGFPQVLQTQEVTIDADSSGRLELARFIGSEQNPLTARVMANRIWQHMIGRGIVASTENFGVTGQPPSHPELLDYLAVRFVQSQWSVKTLIKEIALSRVYRIRSDHHADYHKRDPDNALVWRANPRRLEAEAIRDAMLSISGELDVSRPRGSEVAKAGYTRVRQGRLGDPRELQEKLREEIRRATQQTMQQLAGQRGPFRPGQGGNGNRPNPAFRPGRPPTQDTPARPGPGQRFRQRPGQRFGQRAEQLRGFAGGREAIQQAIREATYKLQHRLDMEDAKHRSVYLTIVRDEEPRSLAVFDFADSSSVTGQRETSNTANQALYLMNNRFVLQQSEAFAKRILAERSAPKEQVDYAFMLAFGRQPTSGERSALTAFAKQFQPAPANGNARLQTVQAICQSLFATAEFRYVD